MVEPLEVTTFNGERGVRAGKDIAVGSRILSVPARNAIQVQTVSPCPDWSAAGS